MAFTDEECSIYPRIAFIPSFYPGVCEKILVFIVSSSTARESRLNRLIQLEEPKILNVKESPIVSFNLKSHVYPEKAIGAE
jgi:hypothetical protein